MFRSVWQLRFTTILVSFGDFFRLGVLFDETLMHCEQSAVFGAQETAQKDLLL